MLLNEWLSMLLLGIVEGLTEFLPISSTGHLILTASWLGVNDEKMQASEIIIQAGAIMAVIWEYRQRIGNMIFKFRNDTVGRNIIIAFVPVLILGPLLHGQIKALLFNPYSVAAALFLGGIAILAAEWWIKKRAEAGLPDCESQPSSVEVDGLSPLRALGIGLFQALAMIPGTSRSAATIIGGIVFGLSRKGATEFSFLLALPTLGGACVYEFYQSRELFTASIDDISLLVFGMAVSFIVALLTIRWLLAFVRSHTFTAFAWYRIALSVIVFSAWPAS